MSDAITEYVGRTVGGVEWLSKCGAAEAVDGAPCRAKTMLVGLGFRRCKEHSPYQIQSMAWYDLIGIYALVPGYVVPAVDSGWVRSRTLVEPVRNGSTLWYRDPAPWSVVVDRAAKEVVITQEPIDLFTLPFTVEARRVAPLHPMRVALLALDPLVEDPTFTASGAMASFLGKSPVVRLMNRGRDGWDIIPGANPETVDRKYWDRVCELVRQVPWAQDEVK